VTDEPVGIARDYGARQGLTGPFLADASGVREAWGVDMVWGNVVRLVDPRGVVVAVGLGDAQRMLGKRRDEQR